MNSSSYRKISLAVALAGFVLLILFPDVVVNLSVEFFHTLFEFIYEFLDVLFEIVETALDHLVEHFFGTNLEETQTIVFYIMVTPLIYLGYRILRRLPSVCKRIKENLIDTGIKYKSDTVLFWQNLSPMNKIKLIAAAAAAFYLLFLISF